MVEKIFRSLEDPEGDQQADEFLKSPEAVERLDKAARSLEECRGISHADVLKRFGYDKV